MDLGEKVVALRILSVSVLLVSVPIVASFVVFRSDHGDSSSHHSLLGPSKPTGECIHVLSALRWLGLSTSGSPLHTVLNITIFNQELWGEIGQDEMEIDRMRLQLEEDCLNVYRKKADQTRKQKADLLQQLSLGEADIDKILSALGERESFPRVSFYVINQFPRYL